MTVYEKLSRYRDSPRGILQFVDEQFGVSLDPWQEDALVAFASPDPAMRRISLQACAGPGKTAVEAWCGLWFLGLQGTKHEHPKGAAVSVSRDNLRDNLWAELAKWLNRSPYLSRYFEWTSNRIACRDHRETWFLAARSFAKSASAEEQGKTLAGLHAEFVVLLIDESGAIPPTILRAGEQALSRCKFGKMLQAGNPISLEGMLYAAATTLRGQWYVIKVTGDPDDPKAWVHSPRVGTEPLEWARQQIATYGRDNPWVKAMILGVFPPSSINTLLSLEEVEASMARAITPDAYEWAQKRLGVDVARFGDDRSVIFPRQGLMAFPPIVKAKVRTTAIAAAVARADARWGGVDLIFVDDTGHWGHGVIDNLIDAGYPVHPVVYSDDAIDPRFYNRRAEMWMQGAEWVKGHGKLPFVPDMVSELTQPTYTFVNGKFLLESKDQIKKRLGKSPDLGDAFMQTFALPDQPASMVKRLKQQSRAKMERDEPAFDVQRAITDAGEDD